MAITNIAQFNPAGRTIPYTPQPGSIGAIQVNNTYVNLMKFDPKVKGEPVDISNFNSPVDPINGVLYREWIMGASDGEFTITANTRDTSVVGWNPMPGDTGKCVLYYSGRLSFGFNYLVVDVGGPADATKSGEFSCTIKANGLINLQGRTNLGGNTTPIT